MNLTAILEVLINLARPFIPLGENKVHEVTQRAVTIPKDTRYQWQRGMGDAEITENERLWRIASDALADALVHTASRGKIKAD